MQCPTLSPNSPCGTEYSSLPYDQSIFASEDQFSSFVNTTLSGFADRNGCLESSVHSLVYFTSMICSILAYDAVQKCSLQSQQQPYMLCWQQCHDAELSLYQLFSNNSKCPSYTEAYARNQELNIVYSYCSAFRQAGDLCLNGIAFEANNCGFNDLSEACKEAVNLDTSCCKSYFSTISSNSNSTTKSNSTLTGLSSTVTTVDSNSASQITLSSTANLPASESKDSSASFSSIPTILVISFIGVTILICALLLFCACTRNKSKKEESDLGIVSDDFKSLAAIISSDKPKQKASGDGFQPIPLPNLPNVSFDLKSVLDTDTMRSRESSFYRDDLLNEYIATPLVSANVLEPIKEVSIKSTSIKTKSHESLTNGENDDQSPAQMFEKNNADSSTVLKQVRFNVNGEVYQPERNTIETNDDYEYFAESNLVPKENLETHSSFEDGYVSQYDSKNFSDASDLLFPCLHPYTPSVTETTHIKLEQGDVIQVVDAFDSGWGEGVMYKNGVEYRGSFPLVVISPLVASMCVGCGGQGMDFEIVEWENERRIMEMISSK